MRHLALFPLHLRVSSLAWSEGGSLSSVVPALPLEFWPQRDLPDRSPRVCLGGPWEFWAPEAPTEHTPLPLPGHAVPPRGYVLHRP